MREKLKIPLSKPRYRLLGDLVYSQAPAWYGNVMRPLRMSLVLPIGEPKARLPLLLWCCGGAWLDVDKDIWIPELMPYVHAGYAVASIEYRLSNNSSFPAPVADAKTAIRFLRANAERFGLDKDRFAIMGESAGGFIAAMVGATGKTERFDGDEWKGESSAVQAAVDWYGPTDFLDLLELEGADPYERYASPENLLLGCFAKDHPEAARAANPATYVDAATPPFLIIHGNADTSVPFRQSELLYAALERAGADASFLELEGARHGSDEFIQAELTNRIIAFLNDKLRIS